MSLRSFLSGLVSSRGDSPLPPDGAPVELSRSHTLGVGTVRRAALSADGARVAVATSLGVAVFHRDSPGREAWFQATPNWAVSVAFSADGERVIGASNEGQAWVWSAASGEQVAELSGEGKLCCALDHDGGVAALGGRTGVSLWNVADATRLRDLEGTSNEIHGLAFHPDGDRIAAVAHSGHVMIWEVTSGREVARWRPGDQPLFDVAFSRDGEHVAAAGGEWTVWNLAMGVPVHTATMKGPLLAVAFSPDGNQVLCGSKRNRAGIWNIGTGELDREVRCHIDDVHSVAFAPGDDQIMLASQKVHWLDRQPDAGPGSEPSCAVRRSLPVFARVVAIASTGDSRLVAVADKQLITVWDRDSGEARAVLDGHSHSVRSVSCNGSGALLVSHSPREVIAWAVDSGAPRWQVRGFGDGKGADVGHVAGAGLADDAVIAVVERVRGRYAIARHDLVSGTVEREIATLPRRGSGIDGFALSPDGSRLALRSTSRLTIWNLADGAEERTIEGAARCDRGVLWSPDSKTLIAAMGDRSVTVWDVASGRQQRALASGDGSITGLVQSRDGEFLAARSKARPGDRIMIWHVASGRALHDSLHDQVHQGPGGVGAICHALALAPDNRTVVAGFSVPSTDGSETGLWVAWHMATGEMIHQERGPATWAARFTPDGETLVTASGEGQATLWTVRRPDDDRDG